MSIVRAKLLTFITIAAMAFVSAGSLYAAADPNSVLILVNDAVAPEAGTGSKGASVFVGEYYATKRGIPFNHILHLNFSLPSPQSFDAQIVSFASFNTSIRQPIKTFLQAQGLTGTIKYIVPTYGIPSGLLDSPVSLSGDIPDTFPTELFSVDSYLASLNSGNDNLYITNPYAVSDPTYKREHFATWVNPLGWNMYLVTRLDGPTAMIAAGLVDKAMQAESTLTRTSGTGYFDWKNRTGDPVDDTMKRAYDLSVAQGMPSVLNDQSVTGTMIQSAPNTLWAWGWYSGPTTCNCYSFVPGAVGAQLTSYTANRIRTMGPGTWVPEWLNAGITATWGATTEPFTSGYALGDNLLNHFWIGYNFAEAAYASSPSLNWAMVFVGDPLYSPPIFNTAITPATFPRVALTGTKTGQFYTGNITISLSLPTSPAVAGVTFLFDGQAVTTEITSAPYRAGGTPGSGVNGPVTITAQVRYANGTTIVTDPLPVLLYNPAVEAPTFSPAAGTYANPVAVTITTPTADAVIRYTLDGTTPTTSSTAVTGPVTISSSATLKAIAYVGTSPSNMTSGLYTITGSGAVTPANGAMTPSSGTATTRTFQWSGVSGINYVQGFIDASNGNLSTVNNCTFVYLPSTNQISLAADGGVMQSSITLGTGSLSNSRCTLNSAASSRTVSNGNLTLSLSFSFTPLFNGTWPVYVAYRAIGADSPVWSQVGSWTVSSGQQQQQVATPAFNPAGGTYSSSQLVTISTTTSGASIRYTTDGSTPTSSTGTLYSGGITVASSQTLKAIAYAAGMTDSAVATAAYTINIVSGPPGNGPMSPASGTATTRTFQWTGVGSINYVLGITDSSNGNLSFNNNCMFGYVPSTNQIVLSADNGAFQPAITLGTGSLSNSKCTLNSAASSQSVVNGTLTLTLSFSFAPSFNGTWPVYVAYRAIGADSPVWSQVGSWTVSSGQQQQQQVATPSFSPAGGTYSSSQLVTISTTTSGASIRYTTDGSTPTSSTGTLYSGGINVASSQTLKAIAYATGMTDSAVATASYTINTVSASPGNGPMSPSSGTATTRTFQWTGVSAINYTLGIIDASNGNLSSSNNCMFGYVPSTNQITLTADNGAFQPAITLGSGSLSNTKCTLNSAGSSQSVVNGTVNLTLSFSFAPSFTGTWPVFVAYRAIGADSPVWSQAGSWTTH